MRPKMAMDAYILWLDRFSGTHQIEYFLSVDHDDPRRYDYVERFKNTGVTVVINQNRSLVDAVNNAAKLITGDCIVVVSDDFECPDDWDILLSMFVATVETPLYSLQVNDGYSHPERLTTIPIISKDLYKRLGYVYNPLYFSMWVDNDLYETCDKMGVLVNVPVLFQHKHWANNKRTKDQTDIRHSSDSAFEQGRKIFEQRKLEGFPA